MMIVMMRMMMKSHDVIDDGDGYDYVENNFHSYEIILFD